MTREKSGYFSEIVFNDDGTISLGRQRLSVSMHLGNKFLQQVESREATSAVAVAVRERLTQQPESNIIGCCFQAGDNQDTFTSRLGHQLGLPPGQAKINSMVDRTYGRRDNFVLVVLGASYLSPAERKKVEKDIEKLAGKQGKKDSMQVIRQDDYSDPVPMSRLYQ